MEKQSIRPLDVCEAPLTGINLIEASAGTGKTRAITDLYVRCLLETERQVSQILVVTFTVAATAELRDRIRRRLVEAHNAFSGQQTEDPFYQHLVTTYANWPQARQKLDNALQGFDEAAIYTIHGFCERVLTEGAFESGMPFEHTLLPDERALRKLSMTSGVARCIMPRRSSSATFSIPGRARSNSSRRYARTLAGPTSRWCRLRLKRVYVESRHSYRLKRHLLRRIRKHKHAGKQRQPR